jgi:hypothetical protein
MARPKRPCASCEYTMTSPFPKTRRGRFSKVLDVVTVDRKHTRALTFENIQ